MQNPSKSLTHCKEGDSKQSPGPSSFLKKQTEQPSKEGTSKHCPEGEWIHASLKKGPGG
jgi:hypothetical protein